MTRLAPLAREDVPELEPVFALVEQAMGFLPNSLLVMARIPELVRAFAGLAAQVQRPGTVDVDLKRLVAFVASRAAGCSYCQAHTGHGAERGGIAAQKLDAAFEFETHPLFDARERAALRLARDAALVPNAVEDAHFELLAEHFDATQTVELLAVVALFGFLNRWNDTLATALEPDPLGFAERALGARGWRAGKHAERPTPANA